MDTEKIVSRLYPEVEPRRRPWLRVKKQIGTWRTRARLTFSRHAWKFRIGAVLLVVWVIAHITWYNRVVMRQYNVHLAWAQVEAEQNRRYNIQQTLVRQVVRYAQHERGLMMDLTELRTRAKESGGALAPGGTVEPEGNFPPSADTPEAPPDRPTQPGTDPLARADLDNLTPAQMRDLFPQIMLMAEQYPNLRLSENFQQVSQAAIETETRIAERIQKYNDEVNLYTTVLMQFPGRMLNQVWRFELYDFYEPLPETMDFNPVDFDPSQGKLPRARANGRPGKLPRSAPVHGTEGSQ